MAQLKWRDTRGWPLAREDTTGKDWGYLLDGGKDGLFLIVISLGWWVHARDPSEESKVDDAIMDVTWVLENLISCLATSISDSPENPPATLARQKARTQPARTVRPPKRLRL